MSQDEFDQKYNKFLSGVIDFNRPMNQAQNHRQTVSFQSSGEQQQSQYSRTQKRDEHAQILDQVMEIRKDIVKTIESSNDYENDIVLDIKNMMDNYIDQTKELVERDRTLKKVVGSVKVNEVTGSIHDKNGEPCLQRKTGTCGKSIRGKNR